MPRSPSVSNDDRPRREQRRRVADQSDLDDDRSDRRHRKHHHHRRERRERSADESTSEVDRSSHRRRYRDRSRSPDRSRDHRRSRSPPAKRRRRSYSSVSKSPPTRRSRAPLPSQDDSFRGDLTQSGASPGERPPEKQKPNFKPTGILAREANTVAGSTTILKYHEPPEARKPSSKHQWRMYVFKKKDLLDTVHLYQRSAWLLGRDPKITDMHLEHPSISKQHAVIQFRYLTTVSDFGDKKSKVKPYLIDLESSNGTKLNGEKIEASRFVELVDKDVIAFGDSEREYVMMLPE